MNCGFFKHQDTQLCLDPEPIQGLAQWETLSTLVPHTLAVR